MQCWPLMVASSKMASSDSTSRSRGLQHTALAYAAAKGSAPMIELLLRNGADPSQVTKEGDTPVELALRFGHAEVADLLKRARQAMDAAPQEQPAPQAS